MIQKHPVLFLVDDSIFRISSSNKRKGSRKRTSSRTTVTTCSFSNHEVLSAICRTATSGEKGTTTTSLWANDPTKENTNTVATEEVNGTDNEISVDTTNNRSNSDENNDIDIHMDTIDAIANGLLIREQEIKNMPLRFIDDGSMEPWEITMTVGKIAEQCIGQFKKQEQQSQEDQQLLEKTMGGRIVAVLFRLDELEELLDEQLSSSLLDNEADYHSFGGVYSPTSSDNNQIATEGKSHDFKAKLKQMILENEDFRKARARSLLALFLHTIEAPGMRRNNVTVPCMDINFLTTAQKEKLLPYTNEQISDSIDTTKSSKVETATTKEEVKEIKKVKEVNNRPSLHPITIEAISEALQLRAQNQTTSPLRLINDETEWYEVQYASVKFAERFMSKKANQEFLSTLTEDERKTISGRIVAVLMRLDDLEWEWNHRIITSDSIMEDIGGENEEIEDIAAANNKEDYWKYTFGLLPTTMDHQHACIATLDATLLFDESFAKIRAERLLAVFLLNVEGPSLEKAKTTMPGGSQVDFITDTSQLQLMMPKDQ